METHFSASLPMPEFHTLEASINVYNKKETSANEKKDELKKINSTIQTIFNDLENNKLGGEEAALAIDKVKALLKKVIVQADDLPIWNQIMQTVETVSPTSNALGLSIKNLTKEQETFIVEQLNLKDINALARTNKHFKAIINQPHLLVKLFDKFSTQLTAAKRYELALKCGPELKKLSLSYFYELDDAKLQTLLQTCPNLEFLDLQHTFIKHLDNLPVGLKELNLSQCTYIRPTEFDKLAGLIHLEKLNLRETNITHFDHLPTSLKELNLDYCYYKKLKPEAFNSLQSLTNLEKLSAKSTDINNLNYLPPNLKELDLSDCGGFGAKVPVSRLRKMYPEQLKNITVTKNMSYPY